MNATASPDIALIDPARLALNDVEAMRIEEFEIDGLPVVIVDDVYVDPQYVRRLRAQSPLPPLWRSVSGGDGIRIDLPTCSCRAR